ncbi:uncharacterized protein EAE97_011507 [Botrytis byssoidea]|uniref:Uncharacterized protein n=1 Tax=Botrytis byssoidea TaxID=139641 RepID=A0A9P5LK89_9HELO|nr:uncharacterized protein EAE97_011507 [Botrytis byssoidea]KAF7920166.1 hypothetical protein EAE97_011507 [Botrytis byssoidea]
MNITNHEGRAVPLAPVHTVVICPTADYKAPNYICYDHVCQYCPKGDQGAQVLYYLQEAVDPHQSGHDHRYQVYATNEHEMPPQHSKAKICHFWCQHEIDRSPLIQRTWYYVPWSDPIPGVLQDDGNMTFTDPVSGHTIIDSSPVLAGFRPYREGDTPFDTDCQKIPSSPSFQLGTKVATPNLDIGSSRSRSSESCDIVVTPRSEYSIPGTHRLPTNRQIPAEPISQTEIEQLHRGGTAFVSQLTGSERTPNRAVYGRRGGEGGRCTEVAVSRVITGGVGRGNGIGNNNTNPPNGPRGGGNGWGYGRGRRGRPTRLWNWHN